MKIFGNKKITIRNLIKSDIKQAKKFQDFINSLAKEEAKILINEKTSIKDEIKFLENIIKTTKRRNKVFLLAESDGKIGHPKIGKVFGQGIGAKIFSVTL